MLNHKLIYLILFNEKYYKFICTKSITKFCNYKLSFDTTTNLYVVNGLDICSSWFDSNKQQLKSTKV